MKMLICIMKYLHPDKRYGLDTISIHKINKTCNSVKNWNQRYGSCFLQLLLCCSIFEPSFMKISFFGSNEAETMSALNFTRDIIQSK